MYNVWTCLLYNRCFHKLMCVIIFDDTYCTTIQAYIQGSTKNEKCHQFNSCFFRYKNNEVIMKKDRRHEDTRTWITACFHWHYAKIAHLVNAQTYFPSLLQNIIIYLTFIFPDVKLTCVHFICHQDDMTWVRSHSKVYFMNYCYYGSKYMDLHMLIASRSPSAAL